MASNEWSLRLEREMNYFNVRCADNHSRFWSTGPHTII